MLMDYCSKRECQRDENPHFIISVAALFLATGTAQAFHDYKKCGKVFVDVNHTHGSAPMPCLTRTTNAAATGAGKNSKP